MLNRSQRNYAHVTTVALSWHVHNFVVIGKVHFKQEHCKFWSNLEFDRNIVRGTGAMSMIMPTCRNQRQWSVLGPKILLINIYLNSNIDISKLHAIEIPCHKFSIVIRTIADGHASTAARTSATVMVVVSDWNMSGYVKVTMLYHPELDEMVDLSQSVMQLARHWCWCSSPSDTIYDSFEIKKVCMLQNLSGFYICFQTEVNICILL